MQTQNIITLDIRGTLISTTDMKRAKKLGQRINLKRLIHGRRAHYETTSDNTILIYTDSDLYEIGV